jgi:DNA-binding beta-propeller fold protein YncE
MEATKSPRGAVIGVVGIALAATVTAQVLFDVKRYFGLAVGLYVGGLALLAIILARPLRRLVPRADSLAQPLTDGREAAPSLSRRTEVLAFFVVMTVAAFFRFYKLDTIPPGFNHDAAMHCQYAIDFLRGKEPLAPYFVPASHYPIGYETFQPLVTAFFMSIVGIVPLASKLSSATSSLAALFVLYFLLRYLFGQRMAVVTSFLGAVCAWHFIFARVGWHCIAVPLWETTAVFLLLAAIKTRRKGLFALAGAATAVNLMTYSISRLLVAKEALLVAYLWLKGLVRPKTHGRGLLLAAIVMLICSVPVIRYAAKHWDAFQGRTRALLILGRADESGVSPLVDNLKKTLLNINYRANGDDFFIDAPLFDFPLSWLFAVGFVICAILFDRPRYGIVLLWFASSMIPGVLSAPNPNHNMSALVPALIIAGVAADFMIDTVRRRAARLGRLARRGAVLIGATAAIATVWWNVRSYIDPQTRRDLWGFYPETRVVGEYMRGILDHYDVYVADNYPIDSLIFLTYRGGDFVPAFHHLWNDGATILTLPLRPPAGKGVAFIAKPETENEPVFRGLVARFSGARVEELRDTIDPLHPNRIAATVVLIEPEALASARKLPRTPAPANTGRPAANAFVGGSGDEPGHFADAMGVAVGPHGSIYVADMHNNRVQKFDRDGRFLMAIGGPGAGDGQFNEPRDVALDGGGNLYVVDTWNARVQKFDPEGRYVASFRTQGGLFGPKGVAVDGNRVLVTDTGNGKIEVFDTTGRHLATWGRAGDGPGEFREPVGIAADGRGDWFVVDSGNGRIQLLDSRGLPVRSWPVEAWGNHRLHEAYLACDPAGSLLLALPETGTVARYAFAGRQLASLGTDLAGPTGVALWRDEVFVSERGANRVRRLR